jgi:2-polyprenyl-6-methoxyphenol hydroxylase-like FAD-dependent oxidoreductase
MRSTQVLVVGAGPSGLALANVLAAHGVDHAVVDRKPGPVEQSRAALVHVRTLELFDRLGIARRALAAGVELSRVEFRHRGRRLATVPFQGQGPFPTPLVLEQSETERLLLERLAELGGGVAWQHTLHGLTGTRAVLGRRDGTTETISARWVVGADGGGSAVRKALGLRFAGRTYPQTGLLADAEIDFAPGTAVEEGTLRLDLTRGGFVGISRLPSGRWRLFGAVPPALATGRVDDKSDDISHDPYGAVNVDDMRWLTDQFDAGATLGRVEWSALFRIHSRLAERFRLGDVFLVGDAAHLHSPAGGQGMNLGIGDAVNLGWKLALVATGRARESMLDSYQAERLPVARRVLRGTDRGFALEATTNPLAAWARIHVGPRLLRPALRLRRVQDAVFGLFAQTWISYRGSPVVGGHSCGRLRPGDRAPHTAATRELRHHLVLFGGPAPLPARYRREAEDIAARYAVDIGVHVFSPGEAHREYGVSEPCALLVRPDGHVAHAGPLTELDATTAHLDRFYRREQP